MLLNGAFRRSNPDETATGSFSANKIKKKPPHREGEAFSFGSGGWIRTSDPLINSQLLYR